MSAPTVLQDPSAFDVFTIDGDASPGISKILSGGERKIKIADQGQPLTLGANTVVQMVENITTTWGFKLWLPSHFKQRDAWIAMFESGGKRSSPRVYMLGERRAPWIKRVIYEGTSPQDNDAPGGPWTWKLTLHEYNRIAVYGGVVAPNDATTRAIESLSASNAADNKQLEALKAADASRKARQKAGVP